jgi:hypothetical protein
MKNKITVLEQVKPNFKKVKEHWKSLLERYYTLDVSTIISINELKIDQDVSADIQSSLDDYIKGDLLRGFWRK